MGIELGSTKHGFQAAERVVRESASAEKFHFMMMIYDFYDKPK